jgi:predicted kinase
MKKLNKMIVYICRGTPGSGKSFTISKFVPESHIFSADKFFINPASGNYEFNINKIGQAHQKCISDVEAAMEEEISPIGVDNTNLRWALIKPYYLLAKQYGYDVEYIESNSPWWKEIKELLKNKTPENIEKVVQISKSKNVHNVPDDTLRKFAMNWVPTEELAQFERMYEKL